MIRRSWAEVDIEQIKRNFMICREALKEGQQAMAVVKADAYGHGDIQVANALQDIGCENFAVSNISEATGLRKAGIRGQILILGYTPLDCVQLLMDYDITQAVISEDYAGRLADFGRVKCHVAVDTGMNRIGLEPERVSAFIDEYKDRLNITGMFTHLNQADCPEGREYTMGQLAKFESIPARGLQKHALNSAGGLWYHDTDSAMARFGITLYGLKPDYDNVLPDGIKGALTWKSVIALVKDVHPGETIGYGRTYKAEKEMRVATVPTGYADGYSRALSNVGYVLVRGQRAPIVGRVCMDQFMIDVTDIDGADFEDEVVLIGSQGNETLTADDMAQMIGTIGYEVVCDISKRVERVYR